MPFFRASSKYSDQEFYIPKNKIKALVSKGKVSSLDSENEKEVEEVIVGARDNAGKISLRRIDDELKRLVNKHKISEVDREGVMGIFKTLFKAE